MACVALRACSCRACARGAHGRNFGIEVDRGSGRGAGQQQREFGERDIDALWVSNMRSVKRPDVLLSVADQLPHVSFHMVGGTCPADSSSSKRPSAGGRSGNVISTARWPIATPASSTAARVLVNTSDIEGFRTLSSGVVERTPVVEFFDPDGVIAREGLGVTVRNTG